MDQYIIQDNRTDKDGNPAGGVTTGVGIDITWQDGPLAHPGGKRSEPNGAFVEGVINAAIGRLQFYQDSKFRCRENALALTSLEIAVMWLNKRTDDRETQGVEGTHGQRASGG